MNGTQFIECICAQYLDMYLNLLDQSQSMFSPAGYDMVPTNLDQCLTIGAVIDQLSYCDILADRGFIGLESQSQIFNLICTHMAPNQYQQNPKSLHRRIGSIQKRIESLSHEQQNTGRLEVRSGTRSPMRANLYLFPQNQNFLILGAVNVS